MWRLYYWDVLSQTDHIDQTTNKKRNNPTKYPRYCGEILSQRFFIKVCYSSSSDCVSLGFEFSFCILKYMKPAIRTTVITIASVGIFIIISLTKSNNHPTNRKRTFFSNTLWGILIKEGIKYTIRLIKYLRLRPKIWINDFIGNSFKKLFFPRRNNSFFSCKKHYYLCYI